MCVIFVCACVLNTTIAGLLPRRLFLLGLSETLLEDRREVVERGGCRFVLDRVVDILSGMIEVTPCVANWSWIESDRRRGVSV